MSTAATVVAQLQAELARANAATGGAAESVHDAITALISGYGGGPAINGSTFDCGTFTLSENAANGTTVNHNLGAAPSAVFLWSTNAPFTARGILGKIRFNDNEIASTSMLAANGALAASTGASGGAYRTSWDAATITFSASSSYPLLASLTYQWLAIA